MDELMSTIIYKICHSTVYQYQSDIIWYDFFI